MDNGYSETFATYEFADKGTYVCMQCAYELDSTYNEWLKLIE